MVASVLGTTRARAVADAPAPATPTAAAPLPDDRPFMVAAEVHAMSGSIGRAVAVGRNVHAVTAAILSQGALWLAEGSVVAGVHSAATAFEPHALLDSLSIEGVKWSETSASW
jgi:hypothetical protein